MRFIFNTDRESTPVLLSDTREVRTALIIGLSIESNDSNAVKDDRVRIEIMVPKLVALAIPENKPGTTTHLKLGVCITNNTPTPVPFSTYGTLIPELVGPNGQALRQREPASKLLELGEYDCLLVLPGKQRAVAVFLDARLSWQHNLLQLDVPTIPAFLLQGSIRSNNSWSIEVLQPGNYQLRFTYDSPNRPVNCFNLETRRFTRVEGIAIGRLATPFVNLRLLQPVESNGNALVVDGICFETLVLERMLPIQENGKTIPAMQLGMSITNNTPTPLRFSFYDSLTPELVGPDDQIIPRNYFMDWLALPQESDFPLAIPGKAVTFFPDAAIQRIEGNQFRLLISVGNGGLWTFNALKLGTYQIQFKYENNKTMVKVDDPESSKTKRIENIWTGMVSMPFVEFSLV